MLLGRFRRVLIRLGAFGTVAFVAFAAFAAFAFGSSFLEPAGALGVLLGLAFLFLATLLEIVVGLSGHWHIRFRYAMPAGSAGRRGA